MTRAADFIVRHRLAVILAWTALLAGCLVFAPRISRVTSGGGFKYPRSESYRASDVLQQEFGQSYGHTVQLLFHGAGVDVSDPAFRETVEGLVGSVMRLEGAAKSVTYYESGLPELVSADGGATYALITFNGTEEDVQQKVPVIRDMAGAVGGMEVNVIGGPAFDHDLEQTSWEDLRTAEAYGLPLVAIILVLVFGSLVAAALPAVLGGISVTTTLAALYLVGHLTAVSVFVLNVVTMLGLGLGIDYSLFMVSRFREELAAGAATADAVRNTIMSAGRAVVFSGAAVVIGMSMLVLFDIVFMRSLGLGGMLVAAFSMLVAVTLLPAALTLLGRRVNAARVVPARYLGDRGGGSWHRWSTAVMRRPTIFLVVSTAVLVALALPLRDMRAGSPGVADLSPESDSRRGIDVLAQQWSPGTVSPVYVVIDTGRAYGVYDDGVLAAVDEVAGVLERDPRVERVEGASRLPLPADRSTLQDPLALRSLAAEDPVTVARLASMVNIRGDSDKTVIRILPTEPGSAGTRDLVRELRSDILPSVAGFSGATVMVGGSAAEVVDFTDLLAEAFPWLMAAVLVITYLVLLLLFRSLILPLKAIFTNLLSVAAAYGVLVLMFQKGWGDSLLGFEAPGGILPFVPVILFSILFGLSMDYEVFMLSRIKEEYDRGGDNEAAVAMGLERTGRIITSAAVIMIVVFGSFALTQTIIIKEFGVGLAVSIFLDATIVRIIMVPATMKLLGRWNWWLPGWLDRLLPDLSLKH